MRSAEESNREINQLEQALDDTARDAETRVAEAWQAGCDYQRAQDVEVVQTVIDDPKWVIRQQNSMLERICLHIAARIKGEPEKHRESDPED